MSHRELCFVLGRKTSLSLLEHKWVAEKEMWAWPRGKFPLLYRPSSGPGTGPVSTLEGQAALFPPKPHVPGGRADVSRAWCCVA